MRVPIMRSVVQRRLLINYRLDPDIAAAIVPAPFEPQLVNGEAVAGICLIRLGELRPRGVPAGFGSTSENAAHRFAVQWREGSDLRTGVYIPERHSASLANVAAGGRFFPGLHERASFRVTETATEIAVAFAARYGRCRVDAAVAISRELTDSKLFADTEAASDFFRASPSGYSPNHRRARLEGVELRTHAWSIEPASIHHVRSSMFDDRERFPPGSIHLDSALVMRNVPAEWHGVGSIAHARMRTAASSSMVV
jgi:hypothetical protein